MISHFHRSHPPPKPSKKRLAKDQLKLLETSFNANQKLKAELKLELAHRLGLSPRQVAIWYQNRRARHKTLAIEHDYKNIQQDLGNVLAQNIRLEKQVSMLKYELNKAQQMMLHHMSTSSSSIRPMPSVQATGYDHACTSSSFLPGKMCSLADAHSLPLVLSSSEFNSRVPNW